MPPIPNRRWVKVILRFALVVCLALLAIYFGGAAVANWWAADAPPRSHDAYYRSQGNAFAIISVACLILSVSVGLQIALSRNRQ